MGGMLVYNFINMYHTYMFLQGYTSIMVSPGATYVYAACMDGIIYKYDIHNAVQRCVGIS